MAESPQARNSVATGGPSRNAIAVRPERVSGGLSSGLSGGGARILAPVAAERGANIAFAITVFRRWWRVAIPAAIVLAALGAAVVWHRFTPEYEASAWLKFDERTPFLAFADSSGGSKAFVQTQIELLRSPLVLEPAIERPELAKLFNLNRKQDVVDSLAKQVKIQPVGESELYKVGYVCDDAAASAALVNAIINSYFHCQADAERTQAVIDLLEKEKANRLKDLVRLRQELGDMARRLTGQENYVYRPQNDTTTKSTVSDLQARLITAQVETSVLEARLEAAQHDAQIQAAKPATSTTSVPLTAEERALRDEMVESAIMDRPEVQKANDAIAAEQSQQTEIELKIKDAANDPMYRQLGSEIAERRAALVELKKSLRTPFEKRSEAILIARRGDKATSDSSRRADELARLQEDLQSHKILAERLQEAYTKELQNAKQYSGPTLELQFKHDELERAEKVFELIATREMQLQTERMAPARASLLRLAEAPQSPVEALPLRNLALAMFLGALAPFGLALGWETWLRRVGAVNDLPKEIGLPVMGEIARRPPAISHAATGSRQSELEYRVYRESIDNLQTALTLSDELRSMRIIAVTSAVSLEGKTSVASQLAISLARSTKGRVLLIDGDMRSPDIHRLFKIDRDPGLAAVLTKKCELADAIVTVWDERLHLLPAGKLTDSPLSFLGEETLKDMLSRVPADYRYIVIDTPPVLAASEALIFAKAADATLICTMRDRSRPGQVSLVSERLRGAGCRPVGVVFSGVPTRSYLQRYGNYDYLAANWTA